MFTWLCPSPEWDFNMYTSREFSSLKIGKKNSGWQRCGLRIVKTKTYILMHTRKWSLVLPFHWDNQLSTQCWLSLNCHRLISNLSIRKNHLQNKNLSSLRMHRQISVTNLMTTMTFFLNPNTNNNGNSTTWTSQINTLKTSFARWMKLKTTTGGDTWTEQKKWLKSIYLLILLI